MRDVIHVANFEGIDEFANVAAIAELTISIGGHELRLRGLAVVRSGRDFRLSLLRYQNSKSAARAPTWESTGELRRVIQEVILEHWRQRRAADRKISASLSREPSEVQLFAKGRD